ncbi:hypothetical protein J6590_082348 [Homalodisca vitripennis]|nr:hypothetical protein J6590_082348 [Homalodisca vitripennis]
MDYAGTLGGNSVSQTHRVPSSDEQNESIALREILGLPPNADSITLRAMILSLKTTIESQPLANGTMGTPHTNVVHSYQSVLANYSLPTYTQTNPIGLHKRSGCLDLQNYSTNLCNLVGKWNLRFDGVKGLISFLERLDELLDACIICRCFQPPGDATFCNRL